MIFGQIMRNSIKNGALIFLVGVFLLTPSSSFALRAPIGGIDGGGTLEPLDVSCVGSPSTINVGGSVIWMAAVTGGAGPTTYSWSGTNSLSGTGSSVVKSYPLIGNGTKSARVEVMRGGQRAVDICSISVINPPSAPTVSLSASPSSIYRGESSTLSWSSTNATSCSGSGFSTGSATSGSRSVSPTANTTYTVTCTGAGGTRSASQTITVTEPSPNPAPISPPSPTPSVSLSATQTTLVSGSSTTLSWSSSNSVSCAGTGFNTNGQTSGSVTVSPSSTRNYSIVCGGASVWQADPIGEDVVDLSCPVSMNAIDQYFPDPNCPSSPNGKTCSYPSSCKVARIQKCNIFAQTYDCSAPSSAVSSSVRITVTAPQPTITFSASPSSIYRGESSTLSWSSTNATSCSGSGTGFSTGNRTSGTDAVAPTANTTYTVTCTGAGGTRSASRTITVTTPSTVAPPPTQSGSTPTVNISANPSSIIRGSSSSLSWSASNAVSCTSSQFSTSNRTSGSVTVSPGSTTNYSLSCNGNSVWQADPDGEQVLDLWCPVPSNAGDQYFPSVPNCPSSPNGKTCSYPSSCKVSRIQNCNVFIQFYDCSVPVTRSSSTRVTVTPPVPPTIPTPTATLSANPTSIITGSSSTLTWSSTNATSCSGSGTGFSTGNRTSGTDAVSPTSNTTYTVSCVAPYTWKQTNYSNTKICSNGVNIQTPNCDDVGGGAGLSCSASQNGQTCKVHGYQESGACTNINSVFGGVTTYTCSSSGSASAQATVSTTPLLVASCSVSPTSIYTGGSATWTATASGGTGSYSYSWSGTNNLSGSTRITSKIYTTAGTKTGTITVTSGSQTKTANCSNTLSVTDEQIADLVAGAVSPTSSMVGQSTTLSGAVSNTGNISSGRAFTSTFHIDNDSNHSLVYSSRQVTTPTTPSGGSKSIQTSFTFPTSGTWYTRLCADQNASGTGTITESSETNNCGGWSTVSVAALPTPTAVISVTPSSIENGQSSLVSWSSGNTTSCTGTNFSTAGATSGSTLVSPTVTTSYTVTCTGIGGSAQDSKTVTVSNKAELTAGAVTPSSATAEEAVALASTISNNGSISTGSAFNTTFFIDNNAGHGSIYTTETRSVNALNVGQSRVSEAAFTFPTEGTWYVQACADQNASGVGTISEFNESNNCSAWKVITVAAPVPPIPDASISLSVNPATVSPQGTARLSWTAVDVSGSCTISGTNGHTFTANTPSGSRNTPTITAQVTYTLSCVDLHGATQRDTVTISLVPEFQEI